MSTSRRSYRELQADASVEVDAAIAAAGGPHCCPSCGHTWTGSSSPTAVQNNPATKARAAALASSGYVLATTLVGIVGQDTFDIWLAKLQLIDGTRTTVDLTAPVDIASWVRDRFSRPLDNAATQLAGGGMRARILTGTVPDVLTLGELLAQCGAPAARRPADAPTETVDTPTDRSTTA